MSLVFRQVLLTRSLKSSASRKLFYFLHFGELFLWPCRIWNCLWLTSFNICVWLHHDWLLFPKCRGCWHHHRQWDGSGPWHWSHVGHGVHRPGQGRRLHCRYCMHALVFVYQLNVLMGVCDRVAYCRTIGALIATSGRHIDRPQQTFTASWMFIFT